MIRRNTLILSGLIVLALVTMFFRLLRSSSPVLQVPVPARTSTTPTNGTSNVEVEAHSPLAAELNSPNGSARRDVEILSELVRQTLLSVKEPYRPPLGINEDFTRLLTGQNRLQLAAVPTNHPALNRDGQLVDRWQTPYFFHPVSVNAVEIRSAGPDRRLFTEDDVIQPARSGTTLSLR